jgi:hypothetical protein
MASTNGRSFFGTPTSPDGAQLWKLSPSGKGSDRNQRM